MLVVRYWRQTSRLDVTISIMKRKRYRIGGEGTIRFFILSHSRGFGFVLQNKHVPPVESLLHWLLPIRVHFKLIQISLSNEFGESLVWKVNLSPNGVEAGVHS